MVNTLLRAALTVCFMICAATVLYSETMYFGERKYEKREGEWYHLDAAADYKVNPRLISVTFHPEISKARIDSLNTDIGTTILKRSTRGICDLNLNGLDPLEAARRYRESPLVKSVSIQTLGHVLSHPNDEYFSAQEHLRRLPERNDIHAVEGWDIETGKGIVLAVIDTGIDVNHPDLRRSLWTNPGEIPGNGVDDDGNGFIDDYHGYHFVYDSADLTQGINLEWMNDNGLLRYGMGYHGTKVAGIAAAETNNILGVAGVAGGWNGEGGSRIMMLGGADSLGITYTEKIRDAIYYAVDNGAKVINLSLGSGDTEDIIAAVDTAAAHGIVLVAASGYSNSTDLPYPARDPHVMAVGAVGTNNRKITHSSYGRDQDALDVAAPSGETLQDTPVYTTFPTGYRGSNGYAPSSQTSSAAPQVAGLACLLLSFAPSLPPEQVCGIICRTADKVGTSTYSDWPEAPYGAWDDSLGYGRINVFKALFAARGYGRITVNTTWHTDMHLTGDVTVDAGKTLRIGKDVTVFCADGKRFIVHGKLILERGAKLTKADGGTWWRGIAVKPDGSLETTGETIIEYADTGVEIENSAGFPKGDYRLTVRNCRQAGIWVSSCSPAIRNVLCDNAADISCRNGGITVSGNGSAPELRLVTIRHSCTGLKIAGPGNTARVDSCTIDSTNAGSSIVLLPHCGVDLDGDNTIIPRAGEKAINSYEDSRYPVHAENNWWGSAAPDWNVIFTWPDSILHDGAKGDSLPSAAAAPPGISGSTAKIAGAGKEQFVAVSPNPANPSTTITFFLPRPSAVRLTIYSITGQKIAVLADGYHGSGVHAVRFDGAHYASGTYLWSFESAGFRKTGKLTIVR